MLQNCKSNVLHAWIEKILCYFLPKLPVCFLHLGPQYHRAWIACWLESGPINFLPGCAKFTSLGRASKTWNNNQFSSHAKHSRATFRFLLAKFNQQVCNGTDFLNQLQISFLFANKREKYFLNVNNSDVFLFHVDKICRLLIICINPHILHFPFKI